MDIAATERAEAELNKFIDSQARRTGAKQANEEAQRLAAEDLRKAREQQERHRQLWVEHLRWLAHNHLRLARDAIAKARRLEEANNA